MTQGLQERFDRQQQGIEHYINQRMTALTNQVAALNSALSALPQQVMKGG